VDLLSIAALALAGGVGWYLLQRANRADAALQRSEAQLRAMFETAFDGVLVTDDQGRIISLNRAAETLFGVAASEVRGVHFRHLLTEGGFHAHQAHVARWSSNSKASQSPLGQSEGRRSNGDAFPMEFSLASWMDGGRLFYAAIFRDVTERAATETSIRRSEAQHRAIIDSAGDGIVVFDEEGRIVSYNRAAETIFGYGARRRWSDGGSGC
jgi:PAS domain S-box-containing protein